MEQVVAQVIVVHVEYLKLVVEIDEYSNRTFLYGKIKLNTIQLR